MKKIAKSIKVEANRLEVLDLLVQDKSDYWRKLNVHLSQLLVHRFIAWPAPPAPVLEENRSVTGQKAQRIVQFLVYDLKQSLDQLSLLKNRHIEYNKRYHHATEGSEKRSQILQYAKELGANSRQLRGDKKAFNRWFGHDAVMDRYQRRCLEKERYISFVLQSLGSIAAMVFVHDGKVAGYQQLWQRLGLEAVIQPLFDYDGDKRIVADAFHCLSIALLALPANLQQQSLNDENLRLIFRASLKSTQPIWVQCEALQLLKTLSPESLLTVLSERLTPRNSNDDLFVRRKAVQILGEVLPDNPGLAPLLDKVIEDPSPYVRQELVLALCNADAEIQRAFFPKLLNDHVEQVKGAAALALLTLLKRPDSLNAAVSWLNNGFEHESSPFVLRTMLKVCKDGAESLFTTQNTANTTVFLQKIIPAIERLHTESEHLNVRRWASQAREYMLCFSSPREQQSFTSLKDFVESIPLGKTRRLPKQFSTLNNDRLARLLSVIAQDDFGFDVETNLFGRYITRGHVFGFRLWRFLHEFKHPSPDKRQAFPHSRGRYFWGQNHVPSTLMAELAETKVPGEPLYINKEDGWRGYLPLVDEVLSALEFGAQPTFIHHHEGVTKIIPPKFFFQRKYAFWKLSRQFAEISKLRNSQNSYQGQEKSYIDSLIELGVQVSFESHRSDAFELTEDMTVQNFFPAIFPFSNIKIWEDFKYYFVSLYENSLYELAVFLSIFGSYFIGKHIFLYNKIKKARKKIPLVVGGWGTRGKSGTERLKAALFNALGYSVISKTTGCEAMFLYAYPFGQLREMFLFRPYDKATIWEQHNLVCLAAQLKSEVFLWECMGLTPTYIDILQRQWMRDDIATITNTFPDHEDLQGPAGIDIPQVMTQFIPPGSDFITSEEQMLPILKHASGKLKTNIACVGWLEAGLLTEDILNRFPYEEHPYNIALVLAMAEKLGVDRNFALKEMADRVVADIGVLKIYPLAIWRSRRLEFINGMSANERVGCLSNWQRLGFEQYNLEQYPDIWITALVNNRADRVSRSRVFSSILVKDLNFDRCVIIGNNLSGFIGYIKESWAEGTADIHLYNDSSSPQAILQHHAERLRIPHSKAQVITRLRIMLEAQEVGFSIIDACINSWEQEDQLGQLLKDNDILFYQEILQFHSENLKLYRSYGEIKQNLQLNANQVSENLQNQFTGLLWQWFESKLVIVEDYYANGNQINQVIGNHTPPGLHNRILGLQNIKGPGLDFVYSWQSWENCFKACQKINTLSVQEFPEGLRELASIKSLGLLAEETVRKTLENAKAAPIAQSQKYQAEIKSILVTLEQNETITNPASQNGLQNKRLINVINAIEAFLDAGDAVKRRKKSDLIYKDLLHERISFNQAVDELQLLNKRQKGGWLAAKLAKANS